LCYGIAPNEFYKERKAVLDMHRGAGYFLWKPFIIHDLIQKIDFGDIVFYLDVDFKFIANPQPLVDLCIKNNGVFLTQLYDEMHKNKYWIKRDAFHFLSCDTPFFHNSAMIESGIQIYQKNKLTIDFTEELLRASTLNPSILTDAPNICGKPNLEGFIEHRHDQAVLSLVARKNGITTFRSPYQFSNHLKLPNHRRQGEWLEKPYVDVGVKNSDFGTILWNGPPPTKFKKALFFLRFEIPAIMEFVFTKQFLLIVFEYIRKREIPQQVKRIFKKYCW
jgi:hypothetical protein